MIATVSSTANGNAATIKVHHDVKRETISVKREMANVKRQNDDLTFHFFLSHFSTCNISLWLVKLFIIDPKHPPKHGAVIGIFQM